MPFWAFPYMLLLMIVTAVSTALKRRLGFPWWWSVIDTLSMAVLLWLFVAYYVPLLLVGSGALAPWLFALVLLWIGLSTHRELQVVEELPALSENSGSGAQWVSLIGGVLLLTPALGLGAIAVARVWQQ
jgi:hypothetical protein